MVLIAAGRERLDRFLANSLPEYSRTKLATYVSSGHVKVNERAAKASLMLEPGMVVEFLEPEADRMSHLQPAAIPLDIVFEDSDLLVVNKPRGLASHPANSLKEPSLVNALLGRSVTLSTMGGDFRPGIVHRLDKDTTGLMVVAKNDFVHAHLAGQMESKSAERRYFAVVSGLVDRERFSVDAPIGRNLQNRMLMAVVQRGRRAITHVKRLGTVEQGVVLAVKLETGRTHQIRVHLSAFGMPVIGDVLYAPPDLRGGPLQLHAAFLAFVHPKSESRLSFFAAPDEAFLGKAFAKENTIDPF